MSEAQPVHSVEYQADFGGMGELLRSPQIKTLLRQQALKANLMAKVLAPHGKTGAFAASIHVETGGTVETINKFGHLSRRSSMLVVASSPDAITIEFGGKRRYSRGQNREGHHTLGQVVKLFNATAKVEQRKQLTTFRATSVSAAPGSPLGGQTSGVTRPSLGV